MDKHEITHTYQSRWDQDIHYDHEPWSNIYIAIPILWIERDIKQLTQNTYAEVHLHEQRNFGHGTAIP